MTVLMPCVCVYTCIAEANPVGAISKACERRAGHWDGHRDRPVGSGAARRERLDPCFSKFHLGPLPPLHFCLVEAAGPWAHCMGRLKGFGGPGEQTGQQPGSAQSAQRGRGRQRAQDRLCHSGRTRHGSCDTPIPSRLRRLVLQLLPNPGTSWGPSP